jgi:methyl-accepting chemotaxis protein
MRIHSEVRLSLVVLFAVQLATTAAAVGLFGRMAPAIERILADNEFSVQAAEDMLAVMARCPHTTPCAGGAELLSGLGKLRQNITEESERPLIADLEREAPRAVGGDPLARVRALESLRLLTSINRDSMAAADAEAKRLGEAGAWATVILGALACALALVFSRRLHRLVVTPVNELSRVARAAREGDFKSRVQKVRSTEELELVSQSVNHLLDRVVAQSARRIEQASPELDRAVLLHLLDRQAQPVLVFERAARRVLAANALATELLVAIGDSDRSRLLEQANEAQVGDHVATADLLLDGRLVVCELVGRD